VASLAERLVNNVPLMLSINQWRAWLKAHALAEGRHLANEHMNKKLATMIYIHCKE